MSQSPVLRSLSRDSVRHYESAEELGGASAANSKLSVSLLANHPLPMLPPPGWENARQLRQSWSAFAMAGIINEAQADALDLLNQARRSDVPSLILAEPAKYEAIFQAVLTTVNTPEALHQLLTIIHDSIADRPLAELYMRLIDPLMRLLTKSDEYVRAIDSIIISKIFVATPTLQQERLSEFFKWLCEDLVGKPAAASNMQLLLRRSDFRAIAVQAGAMTAVARGLRSLIQPIRNVQLIYELVCCCWLVSFESEVCPHMNEDSDIIRVLVDLLRVSEKEKVIRVAVATLRNMSALRQHTSHLITCEGDRVVQNLSRKSFTDPDITEDMRVLQANIDRDLSAFSSMEQYKSELASGVLHWSPVHRNEKFWQENYVAFEDNRKQLLLQLIGLLQAKEPSTIAIACFDLGEFVRFHPRGRKILEEVNAKSAIMMLMTHPDMEVRKQALVAVQKLLVKKWEFMK